MKTNSTSSTGKTIACIDCQMRARSEANPKTLMARLWRWHTRWCPGWKAYQTYLAEQAKV